MKQVTQSLLQVKEIGKALHEAYILQRLEMGEVPISDFIS